MKLNPISRLSYLMTGSSKLSGLLYKNLNNKNFYTFPFLELYLGLKISDNRYIIDEISSKFLDKEKYTFLIECDITPFEKENIKTKILNNIDFMNYSGVVAMWKFYELIKERNEKYIMMPIILYYENSDYSHKAALIYTEKELLFYEPYGTFQKFGTSYKNALDSFNSILGVRKITLFHEKYNLGLGSQTIILNKNNNNNKFNEELDLINKAFKLPKPSEEDKNFDNTVDSIRIIDTIENNAPHLLENSYLLFNKYSSKTCVTLTFIEMFLLSRGYDLKKYLDELAKREYPSYDIITLFDNILCHLYKDKMIDIKKKLSNLKLSNDEILMYLKCK